MGTLQSLIQVLRVIPEAVIEIAITSFVSSNTHISSNVNSLSEQFLGDVDC